MDPATVEEYGSVSSVVSSVVDVEAPAGSVLVTSTVGSSELSACGGEVDVVVLFVWGDVTNEHRCKLLNGHQFELDDFILVNESQLFLNLLGKYLKSSELPLLMTKSEMTL